MKIPTEDLLMDFGTEELSHLEGVGTLADASETYKV
jgi:Mn-containing catalase